MVNLKELKIKYFAALREGAGRSEETVTTQASTAEQLYMELQQRYEFSLQASQLKVAVNNEYQTMDYKLTGGETLVFIPPVAGG